MMRLWKIHILTERTFESMLDSIHCKTLKQLEECAQRKRRRTVDKAIITSLLAENHSLKENVTELETCLRR